MASLQNPMKILHIIASVDPRGGGPIQGVLRQAEHRSPEKYKVNIASLDCPDERIVADCSVYTFGLGSKYIPETSWRRRLPWIRYGYQPGVISWLKNNVSEYDVVVVNGLWNFSTMAARKVLVGSKTPYVVFTHGMLDPWFKNTYPIKSMLKQIFWMFNEGRLLNNASAVLFTTEDERESSRGAFWPYHVRERVVGYGTSDISGDPIVQEAAFRAMIPALGDRRYLLYLSRIHPKKGCDLLIQAFANVAQTYPNTDLVIAGPDQVGWRAQLTEQARALNVAERIHWPGMVAGDAKAGAYRGCDAFVLPSHQENFGIVVAEALAASRPVLVSDKVQIWREVQAGGAGLVEPDNQAGVDRLLTRFMALNDSARLAMARSARATFLENFEMSKSVETINVALREAINGHTS